LAGTDAHLSWSHTKKTLDAARTAISFYSLPIPILQHSPIGICGIGLITLANLSACAFILHGAEWQRTRDRIRLGLGSLKCLGEVWATSKRTEKETKKIARIVFSLPVPTLKSRSDIEFGMEADCYLISTGLEDLSDLDYFTTFSSIGRNTQLNF
jgi:hypothetical protein